MRNLTGKIVKIEDHKELKGILEIIEIHKLRNRLQTATYENLKDPIFPIFFIQDKMGIYVFKHYSLYVGERLVKYQDFIKE